MKHLFLLKESQTSCKTIRDVFQVIFPVIPLGLEAVMEPLMPDESLA